jgi:formylglycine-generating enzyme
MPLAHSRPLVLGLVFLVGCGGKETPSAPPTTFSPPPPSAPAAPAQPKPAQTSAKPVAVTPSKSATDKSRPLPPGASIVGGAEPNARVVPREERPELLAAVFNPNPGTGASLVEVIVVRDESNVSMASLPKGFSAVSGARIDPSGFPLLIRCDTDGAEMALVPGGLGVQGADGTSTAAPRHPIDVDAYYMDVHEVTVEKYLRFREATKGDKTPPSAPVNASSLQQPAVGVNWRDAMQYAKWAGKELPTESEWEKAARGFKGFSYPWGEGRAVWQRRREIGQLDDVGSFRTDESVYGIFDLAGNAREWCQDFFAEDAYKQAPAPGSAAARNWKGPRSDKASRRVVKGSPAGWELWAREGLSMTERAPKVGFRCVLRLTQGPTEKGVAETSPTTNQEASPKDQPATKKAAF